MATAELFYVLNSTFSKTVISNFQLRIRRQEKVCLCVSSLITFIPILQLLFLPLHLLYCSLFLLLIHSHSLFHISDSPSMQMDQSNNSAQSHKLPPQKHSHLVEPVFSSSLLRQKGGGLTNPGLSSGLPCDPRLAGGRGGAPIWTVEDREARMSPLELQVH